MNILETTVLISCLIAVICLGISIYAESTNNLELINACIIILAVTPLIVTFVLVINMTFKRLVE